MFSNAGRECSSESSIAAILKRSLGEDQRQHKWWFTHQKALCRTENVEHHTSGGLVQMLCSKDNLNLLPYGFFHCQKLHSLRPISETLCCDEMKRHWRNLKCYGSGMHWAIIGVYRAVSWPGKTSSCGQSSKWQFSFQNQIFKTKESSIKVEPMFLPWHSRLRLQVQWHGSPWRCGFEP